MTYCPYCGAEARIFGMNTSHDCPNCGALECGPDDSVEELAELELLSEEEARLGWYKPGTTFNA
jgi:hypothetical protein